MYTSFPWPKTKAKKELFLLLCLYFYRQLWQLVIEADCISSSCRGEYINQTQLYRQKTPFVLKACDQSFRSVAKSCVITCQKAKGNQPKSSEKYVKDDLKEKFLNYFVLMHFFLFSSYFFLPDYQRSQVSQKKIFDTFTSHTKLIIPMHISAKSEGIWHLDSHQPRDRGQE